LACGFFFSRGHDKEHPQRLIEIITLYGCLGVCNLLQQKSPDLSPFDASENFNECKLLLMGFLNSFNAASVAGLPISMSAGTHAYREYAVN
jgi:hypothetical protein